MIVTKMRITTTTIMKRVLMNISAMMVMIMPTADKQTPMKRSVSCLLPI